MSRDCPNGKGKGKGAYECAKSNYDGNKGSNHGMYKGGGKGNTELSCPVKGYQKGDGKSGGGEEKDPVVASTTLAVEIMSHEIAPKVEEKEDSGHWKPWEAWEEPPLVEHARVSSSLRRGATQARRSTASAGRSEEEVHDVCGHELQLQGWTSTNRR